jgi:translation initiation factor IF-2
VKLKIAGLKVNDGYMRKNLNFRLVRDGNVVDDNLEAVSLKKFKKEVKDLKGGDEGGISFRKVDEILKGDVIECYINK